MAPLLRRGDFWSGLALAALGAWIVREARGWPYMTEEGPGPGFFPVWYGSLMVVLSLPLGAFGLFAFVEARYRRMHVESVVDG